MIDPGAMGTLLIGLEHARHEFDPLPERQRPTRPSRSVRVRSALATTLHAVAIRVEPRATTVERGIA